MIATQLRINGIATCRLRTGEIGVDLFAGGGGRRWRRETPRQHHRDEHACSATCRGRLA